MAKASTAVTILAGARTPVSLALLPRYAPITASFNADWGAVGESVTINGTNLGLSWAATPSVFFSGTGASMSATVTAFSGSALSATIPAGAVTGPLSILVDGVATTSATFTVSSPALWAVQTPVASAGDTIYLEGGFGQSATVNFPGSVTAAATVLGPGRAKVVVPAYATAGSLTVTTGSITSAGLAFRAPTFSLGIGNVFQGAYDQTAEGRRMSLLSTARSQFGSAVVGKYLYVFGGGSLSSVERASIDAGGNLGAFSTVTGVTLTTARSRFGSAVVGNYLYVFGGYSGSSPTNSVERASIDAGGSLGAFNTVAGMTLITGRMDFGSAVVGKYLYVFGGNGGSGYLTSVERARIDAGGNLGAFETVSGVTLARSGFGSAVVGNYLYVFGGGFGSVLNSVERAGIDAGGNLGAFATVSGVTTATARIGFGSAVVGNYLYVFGGGGASSILNTVERASIDAGGNLGAFATIAGVTLARKRSDFGSAVVGNYLYVFGGDGGLLQNSVERVSINASGSLSKFAWVAGITLATARTGLGSAVVGNYLYVLGGNDFGSYLNSVERASIDAIGNSGTFSTVSGVTLATARSGFGSAVVGSYLYVFGGYGEAGILGSVERADIDSSGNLSAFSTVSGVTLATARSSFGSAVVGNYLYVFGGNGASGDLNSVERASIDAGGNLGAFATVAGITIGARYGFGATVIGNYLYVFGGVGPGYLNSVERASIDAGGNLGTFYVDSNVTLATARSRFGSAVIGNYLYAFGGAGSSGYLRSVERASIDAGGNLGYFSTISEVTLATARTSFGNAVVDNFLYVFGGSSYSGYLNTLERATLP